MRCASRGSVFRSLALLCSVCAAAGAPTAAFPYPEKLTYGVEWRLINAGTAIIDLRRNTLGSNGWRFDVKIESAGLVSRLYRVVDSYKVTTGESLCLLNATLDAQEGKKHTLSHFTIDRARKKMSYDERDLTKTGGDKKELDVASCTFEIAGALGTLRTLKLQPKHSTVIPMTDGRKYSPVRVAAESQDKISVGGKSYQTTRYEAFVFDNVIYKRHGRLLIWVSDDADRVPVQIRLLMGFPIGTVTVSLQKRELSLK